MKPSLTPEAMRVKIAEACGWTDICTQCTDSFERYVHPANRQFTLRGNPPKPRTTAYRISIPDYCNDLNACHEMEKVLTSRQRCLFEAEILQITTGKDRFDYDRGDLIAVITATAEQRCRAFIATLGLADGTNKTHAAKL